ncbi:amino acid permease [Luteolibacter marinus]|uniref:amino acid permease n=1 Tax=Luteolibacter marinus TaxID=2776705 RepID=UPI00186605D1
MSKSNRAGIPAASALVVANMIGTGVFVSLGYQLLDFHSAPPILFLWLLGGLVALCGALCYAELARHLPKSGGEYHFLGAIYHPSLGFMAGLLSAIAGFAAPTAITALAMGAYLNKALPWIDATAAAAVVIVIGAAAHGLSASTSGRVQVVATTLKLLLITVFLVATCVIPGKGDIRWSFDAAEDLPQVLSPMFAGAAFYVFYAYSGWNAAVYGLEEWNRPERTVKRALVGGTLLVTALYVGLNMAFLKAAPVEALKGKEEVGHVAAQAMFGDQAGQVISGLFATGLFASVSALLWAGPRVLGAMARDLPALRFFYSPGEVPLKALAFQAILALVLVGSSKIDSLMTYTQTGLTLCTFLTVAGLFKIGRGGRIPRITYLPALLFVAVTGFVIVRMFMHGWGPATIGLLTAAVCAGLWFPLQRFSR